MQCNAGTLCFAEQAMGLDREIDDVTLILNNAGSCRYVRHFYTNASLWNH